MAKERLSKLQKWILSRCMEEMLLRRNEARKFYGKKLPYGVETRLFPPGMMERVIKPEEMEWYDVTLKEHKLWNYETHSCDIPQEYTIVTPKGEYISTKAEEVSISRSFKKLEDKGFITREKEWRPWRLTERGFLIAKKTATPCDFVNFKDYQSKVEQIDEENKKRLSATEAAFRAVPREDKPAEKAEKKDN